MNDMMKALTEMAARRRAPLGKAQAFSETNSSPAQADACGKRPRNARPARWSCNATSSSASPTSNGGKLSLRGSRCF